MKHCQTLHLDIQIGVEIALDRPESQLDEKYAFTKRAVDPGLDSVYRIIEY